MPSRPKPNSGTFASFPCIFTRPGLSFGDRSWQQFATSHSFPVWNKQDKLVVTRVPGFRTVHTSQLAHPGLDPDSRTYEPSILLVSRGLDGGPLQKLAFLVENVATATLRDLFKRNVVRAFENLPYIYTDGLGFNGADETDPFLKFHEEDRDLQGVAVDPVDAVAAREDLGHRFCSLLIPPPKRLTPRTVSLEVLVEVATNEPVWNGCVLREPLCIDGTYYLGFRCPPLLQALASDVDLIHDSFQNVRRRYEEHPQMLEKIPIGSATLSHPSGGQELPLVSEVLGVRQAFLEISFARLAPLAGASAREFVHYMLRLFDADFLTSALSPQHRKYMRMCLDEFASCVIQSVGSILESPGGLYNIWKMGVFSLTYSKKPGRSDYLQHLVQTTPERHCRVSRMAVENARELVLAGMEPHVVALIPVEKIYKDTTRAFFKRETAFLLQQEVVPHVDEPEPNTTDGHESDDQEGRKSPTLSKAMPDVDNLPDNNAAPIALPEDLAEYPDEEIRRILSEMLDLMRRNKLLTEGQVSLVDLMISENRFVRALIHMQRFPASLVWHAERCQDAMETADRLALYTFKVGGNQITEKEWRKLRDVGKAEYKRNNKLFQAWLKHGVLDKGQPAKLDEARAKLEEAMDYWIGEPIDKFPPWIQD